MSFDPADYHPDWPAVRRQILDQAGHACEFCGAPNRAVVVRDRRDPMAWRVVAGAGERATRIVLTTAHLCWDTCADTRCIDPTHLRALCQACHNRYDRPLRMRHAAATRARKRAGQRAMTGHPGGGDRKDDGA